MLIIIALCQIIFAVAVGLGLKGIREQPTPPGSREGGL